ncbi:hypothetical protein [Paenibacillus sp.]|uniref:hypothetical protein n=1 Tax=Paenibacillus sp. TaxID=58172 RepID=UPI002824C9B8|nr:hypothetical protein [Paenibacillus sp.]MDR0268177.1 hypothetical protein [Paenibacillus sp.]
MKRVCLLFVFLFALSACNNAVENIDEKNTPVTGVIVKEDANTENSTTTKEDTINTTLDFLVEDKDGLSDRDYQTAYEMCVSALSDYYKAMWNDTDINLDTYFDNNNLKQYMQKKITSQHDLYRKPTPTNLVTDIDIEAYKVKLVSGNNPYSHLKLIAHVKHEIGAFGEPTEVLIHNLNGKLVIVDWYCNGKDSYDFIVRGESQTITNPDIWNDSEWVKKLDLTTYTNLTYIKIHLLGQTTNMLL